MSIKTMIAAALAWLAGGADTNVREGHELAGVKNTGNLAMCYGGPLHGRLVSVQPSGKLRVPRMESFPSIGASTIDQDTYTTLRYILRGRRSVRIHLFDGMVVTPTEDQVEADAIQWNLIEELRCG